MAHERAELIKLPTSASTPVLPTLKPARRALASVASLSRLAESDEKVPAWSMAERDRLARDRAAKLKVFMEERDSMRRDTNYMKALRNTLDLYPASMPRRPAPRAGVGGAGRLRRSHDDGSSPRLTNVVRLTVHERDATGAEEAAEQSSPGESAAAAKQKGTQQGTQQQGGQRAGPPKGKKGKVRKRVKRLLEGGKAFDAVVQSHKMIHEKERWSQWPFNGDAAPVSASQGPRGSSGRPARMRAPHALAMAVDSATIGWDPLPTSAGVAGYELEVSHVNALSGPTGWSRAYRGPKLQTVCKPLGRELVGLRVRVRAYSGAGKGDWSPRSELLRLAPLCPPVREEIEELPRTWLTIDLAGLPELSPSAVNPALLAMTKAELVRALHTHRTVIKIAFRYYALAGVSDVDDDPSTMTMLQFANFAKGCWLVREGRLSSSDIDRIFLRATRAQALIGLSKAGATAAPEPGTDGAAADTEGAGSLLSALAETGVKASKDWRKAKTSISAVNRMGKGAAAGKEMSQSQFVAALIRLAAARYPEEELSLAAKLGRLVTEQMESHVLEELQLLEDPIRTRMRTRLIGAVLSRHAASLRQIFDAYARADTHTAEARKALGTLNVLECNQLLEDIGVYDPKFTVREMLSAFVKVNIDDDLYYQDEARGEGSSSSEVDFGEFEEWLARIFGAAVWARMQSVADTAALLDQDGDGDLDADDADDLFDECDTDGSGSIDASELLAALGKRLNEGAAKLVCDHLMALADVDGSGTISREELRVAIVAMTDHKKQGKDSAEALERAFDEWLAVSFVPKALAAMRRKKLGDPLKAATLAVVAVRSI